MPQFKDEVRVLGKSLGLKDIIRNKHPFPGPGLAIRIIGNITPRKIKVLQEADHIYINELIINPNRVNCNDLLINFCAFLSSAYANFLLTKNIVINPGINNKR